MILDLIGVLLGVLILGRIHHMNQKLTDAIAALNAEVADSKGKLESIRTFVMGVPAMVAAAVETALSNANVDEETAATEIAAATDAVSGSIDDTLNAIDANPQPGEQPVSDQPVAEAPAAGDDAGAAPADDAA